MAAILWPDFDHVDRARRRALEALPQVLKVQPGRSVAFSWGARDSSFLLSLAPEDRPGRRIPDSNAAAATSPSVRYFSGMNWPLSGVCLRLLDLCRKLVVVL
jgi:hypothetical protein